MTAASNWMSPARSRAVLAAARPGPGRRRRPRWCCRSGRAGCRWRPRRRRRASAAAEHRRHHHRRAGSPGSSAAMSLAGSAPATVAADRVPSANVTLIASAPSTTCSAVRMVPSALTITPVPVADWPGLGVPVRRGARRRSSRSAPPRAAASGRPRPRSAARPRRTARPTARRAACRRAAAEQHHRGDRHGPGHDDADQHLPAQSRGVPPALLGSLGRGARRLGALARRAPSSRHDRQTPASFDSRIVSSKLAVSGARFPHREITLGYQKSRKPGTGAGSPGPPRMCVRCRIRARSGGRKRRLAGPGSCCWLSPQHRGRRHLRLGAVRAGRR